MNYTYILKRFQKEIKKFCSEKDALEWLDRNDPNVRSYCFTHGYGLYVIRDGKELKLYGW